MNKENNWQLQSKWKVKRAEFSRPPKGEKEHNQFSARERQLKNAPGKLQYIRNLNRWDQYQFIKIMKWRWQTQSEFKQSEGQHKVEHPEVQPFWEYGNQNFRVFFTKHHSPSHHQLMKLLYLQLQLNLADLDSHVHGCIVRKVFQPTRLQ